MARETKFGLLFVLVLTGTFGMLVYKRLHQPSDLMAVAEPAADGDSTADDTTGDDLTGLLAVPESADAVAQVTMSPPAQSGPSALPQRPKSPVSVATRAVTAGDQSPTRPARPAELEDDDFFGAPDPQPTVGARSLPQSTPQTAPAQFDPTDQTLADRQPETDPFGFAAPMPVVTNAASNAAAATAEVAAAEPEFDPFGDPIPVSGSLAEVEEPPALESAMSAPAESDPFPDPGSTDVDRLRQSDPARNSVMTVPTAEADPFGDPLPTKVTSEIAPQPVPSVELDPFEKPSEVAAPKPAEALSARESLPVTADDSLDRAPEQPPQDFVSNPNVRVSPKVLSAPLARSPVETVPEEAFPVAERMATPGNASPSTPTQLDLSPEELGGFRPVKVMESEAASTTIVERNEAKADEGDPFAEPSPALTPAPVVTSPPAAPLRKFASATTEVDFGGPAQAAPAAATERVENNGGYVVQPSDSYWTISKRVYGTGRYFQALAKHNVGVVSDPQKLKPGMRVATPPAKQLETLYRADIPLAAAPAVEQLRSIHPERYQPEADPGFFVDPQGQPMYRVGSSDTLSTIAQNHLGRSSRWVQIFQLNRDILKDGNTLSVGAILKLPADASQVQVVGFETDNR